MKLLTRQELIDIVNGAAIYGTGGGGSLTVGLRLTRLWMPAMNSNWWILTSWRRTI